MYTESTVEAATLEWFVSLGFTVPQGPEIGPESDAPERASFGDVVLRGRLDDALSRPNPERGRGAAPFPAKSVSSMGVHSE